MCKGKFALIFSLLGKIFSGIPLCNSTCRSSISCDTSWSCHDDQWWKTMGKSLSHFLTLIKLSLEQHVALQIMSSICVSPVSPTEKKSIHILEAKTSEKPKFSVKNKPSITWVVLKNRTPIYSNYCSMFGLQKKLLAKMLSGGEAN